MGRSEATATPWWLVLIEGISLVVLGILFIAYPAATATAIVVLLGIYWMIAGIFKIVSLFQDS